MALLFQKVRGILGLASHPAVATVHCMAGIELKLSAAERFGTVASLSSLIFWFSEVTGVEHGSLVRHGMGYGMRLCLTIDELR